MKKYLVHWTSIKLLSVKDTTKKMNRHTTNWKKILAERTSDKRLTSKIYKELLKHNSKKLPFKNGQKEWSQDGRGSRHRFPCLLIPMILTRCWQGTFNNQGNRRTAPLPHDQAQCRGEPGREEKSRLEVNIVAEGKLGKGTEEAWFSHPGDQREGEGSPGLRIHWGKHLAFPTHSAPGSLQGTPTSSGAPLHLPNALHHLGLPLPSGAHSEGPSLPGYVLWI